MMVNNDFSVSYIVCTNTYMSIVTRTDTIIKIKHYIFRAFLPKTVKISVDNIVNQVYNTYMDREKLNEMLTTKYAQYADILEKSLKFINVYNEYERKPKSFGTDELYYSLEIHTIHAIGKNAEMNVTEIADWHGISKSATSKVLNKLEKKGAVHRYKAPNNKKEVLFGLTEKGKKAFYGHIEDHIKFKKEIFQKFDSISDEKLKNFEEVLLSLIEFGQNQE
ncbi:DNA-binding transcriptional regulator, MarR family [Natronincola peptidivorans]|uniref:DNA-binding transcriptional regulator, MarR family n=1 Tax=Natronincola peptidivorans TaxID=426128 RepID=A0A1I0FUH1_9FIRM|nr:MarR family transcriptional regulator [Natronincola peptidivorans]SET61220.1 DNA-binding transcriptional regulator, MarR family [Natronincola peptidivorans]